MMKKASRPWKKIFLQVCDYVSEFGESDSPQAERTHEPSHIEILWIIRLRRIKIWNWLGLPDNALFDPWLCN